MATKNYLNYEGLQALVKHIPQISAGDNIVLTPDVDKPNKITISTDIETYEAGDNVEFVSDAETGKTKINANLAVPYTFQVDEEGNLIAYFPDDATPEEMEEVVRINGNGDLILTV